jgi:hypothetical protein
MIDAMVLEESDAAARQDRSTAAQLGWRAVDGLADTTSLPTRIAFLNQLHREVSGEWRAGGACVMLREVLEPVQASDAKAVPGQRPIQPLLHLSAACKHHHHRCPSPLCKCSRARRCVCA